MKSLLSYNQGLTGLKHLSLQKTRTTRVETHLPSILFGVVLDCDIDQRNLAKAHCTLQLGMH